MNVSSVPCTMSVGAVILSSTACGCSQNTSFNKARPCFTPGRWLMCLRCARSAGLLTGA